MRAHYTRSTICPLNLMFSHVVIFWTKPEVANATDALFAGAEKYLRPIPGVVQFSRRAMVNSHRDVVDQSYQVGAEPAV